MSAPPPAYHEGKAVSLDEEAGARSIPRPPHAHTVPVSLPEAAPSIMPALEPKKPIRCPKCTTVFDWTAQRPTTVVCPSCGTSGRIG